MGWTTPIYIQSLYYSIHRRIRSVIVAKGHNEILKMTGM